MSRDCERDGHCGHLREDPAAMASGGLASAWCCWCGEWTRVRWELEKRGKAGHGPHLFTDRRVYDWPKGWSDGDA